MSRSNGRLESEVIVNFADGLAYSKAKLEDAFRNGLLDKPVKPPKEITGVSVKRDDVDLIVHEFDLPRGQAEKALVEAGGDVTKALMTLISP